MFIKIATVNILHMFEKEEKNMITMKTEMADLRKKKTQIEILEMKNTLSEMKNRI